MILNHASLAPAGWREALGYLPDLADGMASLVRAGVAQTTLRMSRSVHERYWPDDGSLFDAFLEAKRRGARDQFVFLMKLSEKAPLLSDLDPEVGNRFRMCEAKALPPDDGSPLVLCAITDAIAVGFPSEPVWDRDRLRIAFQELLPDGTLADAREEIDNLARSAHAGPIVDRRRRLLRRLCAGAPDLWSRRGTLYPHLTFGPDVEGHLEDLNPGWFSTLVNRLADLDETAQEWEAAGGDAPPWKTLVTPESGRLMDNPKLREARRFRAVSGERVLFEWHARFGSGARIHLRFDAETREIEIGYIGVHLPL